ncbi:antitoxin Xre/MbcA/ParS toxin-binding domain-containing protein [Cognatilysobacter segetis]|uniref:antitoxin Xre/MbcA/ParS toxin-binding domain-containing protein n=1 Tax=Cognatilysobacter segetis TaxID=2492394 RepID=UPI0013903401|nr:antitoxin Xre/MbcA/ParS toxin-binding domain-containing protein [Lysobacter segetis]
MTSKHIGPLFGRAWLAAWKRIWQSPERLERLERGLRAAAGAPVRLNGRRKAGDPEPPVSPEFQAALDEELVIRGLAPGGIGDASGQADQVLAKAAGRAARHLRLSDAALERLLPPELMRLADGAPGEAPPVATEIRERALCLIRIYQELDAIVPSENEAHEWLRGHNTELGDSPLALLEDGRLEDVLAHLERARHR